MFLTGHMQNAYVTHDLDKAMEIVGNRFGVEKFDRFDPDMVVNTPHGPQPMAKTPSQPRLCPGAANGARPGVSHATAQDLRRQRERRALHRAKGIASQKGYPLARHAGSRQRCACKHENRIAQQALAQYIMVHPFCPRRGAQRFQQEPTGHEAYSQHQ